MIHFPQVSSSHGYIVKIKQLARLLIRLLISGKWSQCLTVVKPTSEWAKAKTTNTTKLSEPERRWPIQKKKKIQSLSSPVEQNRRKQRHDKKMTAHPGYQCITCIKHLMCCNLFRWLRGAGDEGLFCHHPRSLYLISSQANTGLHQVFIQLAFLCPLLTHWGVPLSKCTPEASLLDVKGLPVW